MATDKVQIQTGKYIADTGSECFSMLGKLKRGG
jgi:hypothetical protein